MQHYSFISKKKRISVPKGLEGKSSIILCKQKKEVGLEG